MMSITYKDETLAIRAGDRAEATIKAVAVPMIIKPPRISLTIPNTGADLFDLKVHDNIYTRIMNLTTLVLAFDVQEWFLAGKMRFIDALKLFTRLDQH